jgi:rod shape-determining protein MreD
MTKAKNKLYIKTTNIGFWLVVLVASLLPLALVRLGIELYLTPQIEIAVTFFLSIYSRAKSWQFFIYGLFIDVAYGNPIGVSSIILLLLNYIISKFNANLSKQSMRIILVYFAYSIVAIAALKYIIFSICYASESLNFNRKILINSLINIIFYPIIHLLLSNRVNLKTHENQQ